MTRKINTKTKKPKTRKIKTRKRNKSKKYISNKYFGGEKDGGETNPTTVNAKPRQASKYVNGVVGHLDNAANNVDNLTNSTVEGVNNLADSAEKGATVIGNAASNIGNAALDSADKLTQQTADNYNKLKHSLLKSHDAISKQVYDNEEYKHYRPHNIDDSVENDETESEEKRTERFKAIQGHAIDLKNKHTELTTKIEGLKKKYETKGDNDLKNSLELENALKLHAEVEELLKNPLIENLIDSSNEQVNEILASGMKMFGNAVTTAGESIPLVGEVVVLENMFRHFLYNISDGSNAATQIEQNLDQVGNLMSNISDATEAKSDDESNETETTSSPDGEPTETSPDGETTTESSDGKTTTSPDGEIGETVQEISETKPSSPDGEPVEKKTTSSPDSETIKNTPTIEVPLKPTNNSVSSPTQDQDFTKSIINNDDTNHTPTLAQGGAINAMQHRIHTSIHDFLQSSILNAW